MVVHRGITLDTPQAGRPTTTVPAAARLLGIDVRTARARIVRGELPGGAVAKEHRLRWFVYSDALMASDGRTDDCQAEVDDGYEMVKEVASLLQRAHSELQASLNHNSGGLDHLGRARAELAANEDALTKSFNDLRAALALIDEKGRGSYDIGEPG